MLLKPATTAAGREPKAEGILGEVSGFETETFCWKKVVADYADVLLSRGCQLSGKQSTKLSCYLVLCLSTGDSTVYLLLSWQKSGGSWMITWGKAASICLVHPMVLQSSSLGRRLVSFG